MKNIWIYTVFGRGESVAMKSNYCEIDPNKVDNAVPYLDLIINGLIMR